MLDQKSFSRAHNTISQMVTNRSSTRAVWSNLRVRNPRAAVIICVAPVCSSSLRLSGGLWCKSPASLRDRNYCLLQGLWPLMPLFHPSVTSALPDSCTGGLLRMQLGAKSTSSLCRTWFTVTGNDTVPETGTLDVVPGYVDERHETTLLALQVSTLLWYFLCWNNCCVFIICPAGVGLTFQDTDVVNLLADTFLYRLIISKNCSFVEGSEGLIHWLASCKRAVISLDALSSIESLYQPLPITVCPFCIEAEVLVRNLSKFVHNKIHLSGTSHIDVSGVPAFSNEKTFTA